MAGSSTEPGPGIKCRMDQADARTAYRCGVGDRSARRARGGGRWHYRTASLIWRELLTEESVVYPGTGPTAHLVAWQEPR